MPDLIRFFQRALGKLTGHREWFGFAPEIYTQQGLQITPLRAWQTRMGQRFGVRWFSRRYPGIVGRVHLHDTMLQSDAPAEIAKYADVGRSAMENIEASLAAAGRDFASIRTCLDMACGYGRVLRLLLTRVPAAGVTACDIDEEGLRFVGAEFGVRTIHSTKDLRALRLPDQYDLIWVGSLFSHLPIDIGLDVIDLLLERLTPGGVLVFTTQGPPCLEMLGFYGWMFPPQERMFREQMAGPGMAYWHYFDSDPSYGIAMYRRDALERAVLERNPGRVRLARYAEQGWDKHQDAWAFQRLAN